jgi:hypothetical protein
MVLCTYLKSKVDNLEFKVETLERRSTSQQVQIKDLKSELAVEKRNHQAALDALARVHLTPQEPMVEASNTPGSSLSLEDDATIKGEDINVFIVVRDPMSAQAQG